MARLAVVAAVLHKFLHAFENLCNGHAPHYAGGNQSLESDG